MVSPPSTSQWDGWLFHQSRPPLLFLFHGRSGRGWTLFPSESLPWDRIWQGATDGACLLCLSRKRPSPTRNGAASERLEALKYQRIKKPKKPSKGNSKSKKQISECQTPDSSPLPVPPALGSAQCSLKSMTWNGDWFGLRARGCHSVKRLTWLQGHGGVPFLGSSEVTDPPARILLPWAICLQPLRPKVVYSLLLTPTWIALSWSFPLDLCQVPPITNPATSYSLTSPYPVPPVPLNDLS